MGIYSERRLFIESAMKEKKQTIKVYIYKGEAYGPDAGRLKSTLEADFNALSKLRREICSPDDIASLKLMIKLAEFHEDPEKLARFVSL